MIFREIGVYAARPKGFRKRGRWPTKRRDIFFEDSSRVVCALIVRGIGRRVRTDGVWKLNITVNDSESGAVLIDGVFDLHEKFNIGAHVKLPPETRREAMLQFVQDALVRVRQQLKLSVGEIRAAAEFVRRHGFVMKRESKRAHSPKEPKRTAHIEVVHMEATAVICAVFSQGRQELARRRIAETRPDEFIFGPYLGTIRWVGDDVCELKKTTGQTVRLPVPKAFIGDERKQSSHARKQTKLARRSEERGEGV